MGERHIVLDCSQLGLVSELLNQAQQVAMTTLAQSYLITSLVCIRQKQASDDPYSPNIISKRNLITGYAHPRLRDVQTGRRQHYRTPYD